MCGHAFYRITVACICLFSFKLYCTFKFYSMNCWGCRCRMLNVILALLWFGFVFIGILLETIEFCCVSNHGKRTHSYLQQEAWFFFVFRCLAFHTETSSMASEAVKALAPPNFQLLLFTVQCTLVQSAVLRLHAVRPSVCPSVCDIGGLWSHRLKILETNCTNN